MPITKPAAAKARQTTGLVNPTNENGFGRGEHFRAYTAAEKIHNVVSFGHYQYNPAVDLGPTPRAGSMDASACPSRIGDKLFYRSGEVEIDVIPHNPKPAYACY